MAKKGPILLVDDDLEDLEIMAEIIKEITLENEIRQFERGEDVLSYLMSTTDRPFLIIAEFSLKGMSGLQLRKKVEEAFTLRNKSIPFIFLSNSSLQQHVDEAYSTMIQGYIEKPFVMEELKETLRLVVNYWKRCSHPWVKE